jgi:alpha-1,3-rhamnosyltransferase
MEAMRMNNYSEISESIDKPLVSVIIPAYNHEKYVQKAIKSVIDQTYKNIELIVINDGSTDDTHQQILQIENECRQRFSSYIYVNKPNEGLIKTLNFSTPYLKGKYVCFLASDDEYLPLKIEKNVTALESASFSEAAVYSDGYIIDSQGNRVDRFSSKYAVPIGTNTHRELYIANWIAALSIMYRLEAFLSCMPYDESIMVEDYDFLLKFSAKYKFIYLYEPLFLYRWHGSNFSSDAELMSKQIDKIYSKYPEIIKYKLLIFNIKNRNIMSTIKCCDVNTANLMIRNIIRKIQAKLQVMNVTYFELLLVLLNRLALMLATRTKVNYLKCKGVSIGSNVKINGKINIIGNPKNIIIKDGVRFLGDIRIITDNSRYRETITIGAFTIIDHNAILFTHGGDLSIGERCFIGPSVHIQAKGGVDIGNDTMIAGYTAVYASNHITSNPDMPFKEQGEKFIGIVIGKNCWIGTNVVILDGTVIGNNTIIGANATVRGIHSENTTLIAKGTIGKSFDDI